MPTKNEYYPKKGRVILHIDMNAFYCSVHSAVQPDQYKGKCLAVAGSVELRKGIIVTSSYEARKTGVRTGMQVRQALKLCPDLIVIRPDFDLYRQFSKRFFEIAMDYSPLVEAMSIDECFVDITGSKLFGTPIEIAEMIQKRIREELGLPCSVGIAPNKLLAKMASDLKKPNGLTILRLRDVEKVLWHQSCSALFGIGERTAKKLNQLGIHTIGELAKADEIKLTDSFGVLGSNLKRSANGIDESPVQAVSEKPKSVGHSVTLPFDYTDKESIQRVFFNLADQVTRRLRRHDTLAQVVQITIRDPSMKTIQRSITLSTWTEHADVVYKTACQLFEQNWPESKPVRLLGITLSHLQDKQEAYVQQDLFSMENAELKDELLQTMDRIRDKFGENALLTARMLGNDPSALLRDHKVRGTSLDKDNIRNMFKDKG